MKAQETMPVNLRVQRLKDEIDAAVGRSRLPPFMVEMVLGQYLAGVSMVARQEYEETLKEWDDRKEEKKNG